jgi:hypothetical protein
MLRTFILEVYGWNLCRGHAYCNLYCSSQSLVANSGNVLRKSPRYLFSAYKNNLSEVPFEAKLVQSR